MKLFYFCHMDFSSKLLENAVFEVAQLPGIGKKSALRLVLHLLKQPEEQTVNLSNALLHLKKHIQYCKKCHNLSDNAICDICNNLNRDHQTLCVVEDIRDVMAIENTNQYQGVYHVLGGKISPMEGIGPSQLNIESLIDKVRSNSVKEVILALSSTMEADTTNFYIYKKLEPYSVMVSSISKGISVGNELEYTDEVTLARSILLRIPFEKTLKQY